MSLKRQSPREMPPEMAAWGARHLADDNPYKLVGDRLYAQFHQQYAADLVLLNAPPRLVPLDIAFVLAFQALERLDNDQAAEWLCSRLDWKYALHLPVDHPGCTAHALKIVRKRLLALPPGVAVVRAILTTLDTNTSFP